MSNISSVSIKSRGKNGLSTIRITDECTIYNVEDIYKLLKSKLKSLKVEKVIVEDIVNIDLAGMQMLISLKEYLAGKNPGVVFEYILEDNLKQLIVNTGFNDIIHN